MPRGVEALGRECDPRINGFKLDWGGVSQAPLATEAVIGPLDTGDDREAHFLAYHPVPVVEDVPLMQREERLHGGIVTDGSNSAFFPGPRQVRTEFGSPKSRDIEPLLVGLTDAWLSTSGAKGTGIDDLNLHR